MSSKKHPFNIMAFPNGPICNLDCEYCYYLCKSNLYKDTVNFQMPEELLEKYIKQYIESQAGPVVNFAWQGGEPTLRGLDFFKKVMEFQEKYLPKGWKSQNSLQTNGILLDDNWCKFLEDHNFLLGISLDGPEEIHDKYRKDKKGRGTHKQVTKAINKVRNYKIDFNILAVVNDVSSKSPLEIYDYFKKMRVDFIQFIPIVEVDKYGKIGSRSVKSEDYGRFLIDIFNQWLRNDIGNIFIQIFEECVRAWMGFEPGLCIFSKKCGDAAVLEYNGDLYSCDHFVSPKYKLGNINETEIKKLMISEQQREFGISKKDQLAQICRDCEYCFICNGGCLKNRIVDLGNGENLNYLCDGYKLFFNYIDPFMKELSNMIRQHSSSVKMQKRLTDLYIEVWDVGRNDPCPCGSGNKYKRCCLDK